MVFACIFSRLARALEPLSRQACLLLMVGSMGLANAKPVVQDSAVVQTPELRAELVAYAPEGIGHGKPWSLGLLLDHQPQWHTYWVNPGDSGLATELQWTLPAGAQAGAIDWPVPQKIKIGALANLGYEGQVLLPVQVQVQPQWQAPNGKVTVRLHASWLVCRQECIPQEGDFALTLPVQGSTAMHAPLFEIAKQKQPARFDGPIKSTFTTDGLLLQVAGLPQAWRGKAIAVYPEAPSVFATPALPDPQDRVASSIDLRPSALPTATQKWDGDNWSASLPLSRQRTHAPDSLIFVFSYAGDALRARVAAPGPWPEASHMSSQTEAIPLSSANSPPAVAPNVPTMAFGAALVAAFAGGLLLNLMPCVFPVLALKALGLATLPGSARQRKAQAAAYTGGVLLSMVVLGALLLGLRAGGQALGWGFHLQSPIFIAVLATLFTLICLNLMDLLDGSKLVPSNLAGLQMRNPVTDAALSGVLAVVVASPCTAPFMGASLGLAMTLPAWQALCIFIALGLGLALPYALVTNSAALARRLPRPGPWMEHLRQFMVFPMAATVLWLVWVFAQMVGPDMAALLVAMLLCLAMGLWALRLPGRAALGFGALALLLLLVTTRLSWHIAMREGTLGAASAQTAPQAAWRNWTAQGAQQALAAGQPVFIDFTAAWCITCQYNEQQVLAKPDVLQAFADKNVLLLRADWTRRDAAISQALQQLGRSGVPVYVLLHPDKPPVVFSEILQSDALLAELSAM